MLKLGRSATKIGTNVWSMEKGATPWATTGNTMEKGATATPLVESNTFQVVSYILIIFMVITMAPAMLILAITITIIVISMIVKRMIYDRDMDAATPMDSSLKGVSLRLTEIS